ncbi:regulator of chromosome condensation 1/beta-lactamase-inhibitor protein II, partial [Pisolithus microcarpus]
LINLDLRALHTRRAVQQVRSDWARSAVFASATASATAILVCGASGEPEFLNSNINSTGVDENGSLQGVAWGSNNIPQTSAWLENVALRDLALHERHAACVDARGDVYQWGDGFFSSAFYLRTRGKETKADFIRQGTSCCEDLFDIVRVRVTDSKVYALSASGKIYVFAANEGLQKPKHRGSSWWGFDWLWRGRTDIDFVELFPREKLKWREHFTNITTGRDHVVALTSAGRVFSHPVNMNANSHGQLGLRKVDLLAPSGSPSDGSSGRMAVELNPKAIADPYAKSSQTIRFCDSLFEIPALKAGGRSTYVNTDAGRVLGWGANEFGQLGLGNGIVLDAVTIPTEVILTRNLPLDVKSKCLGSGDLTFFVAERIGSDASRHIDVLSCGNGQWGGLGANLYTTGQANPVRVKNYDERTQSLAPIVPEAISVSPTGHALLTLDTLSRAGPGFTGRDLLVWGLNYDFQLGTGKRKSLPAPTILNRPEGGRFLLARKTATVKDMAGSVWRKKVGIEQRAIAGYGTSLVYWGIISS